MAEITMTEENWTKADEINKVIEAIDERAIAIGLKPLSYEKAYPVNPGDNIQLASFWNGILAKLYELQTGHNHLTYSMNAFEYIEIHENLQRWIKYQFLTKVIGWIKSESSGVISLDYTSVTPHIYTGRPIGCEYSSLTFGGLPIEAPSVPCTLVLYSASADDYLIVDGKRLDSLSLVSSYDGRCPNIAGSRNYLRNIVIGTIDSTSIAVEVVDTIGDMCGSSIDPNYYPFFNYYPVNTSEFIHA